MTIFGILSLYFVPLFNFTHEMREYAELTQDPDMVVKAHRIDLALIWLNFFLAALFGLEIAMKAFAFGLRRAYAQLNWVLKAECFAQPLLWLLFIFFIFGGGKNSDYGIEKDVFSLIILLRALRLSSLLNEISLWRNFMRTIRALLRPFMNFGITLYSLFLIYASIGLQAFGGKINQESMTQFMA